MSKCVKRMMLDAFGDVLSQRCDFIVVDSSKVVGVDINRIRLDLSDVKVSLIGVKNAIAAKAFEESGVNGVGEIFTGPSSIVFGGIDVVELSKRVVQCVDANKSMVIRGGVLDGQVFDHAGILSISRSPGRLELLSSISAIILSQGIAISSAVISSGALIAGQVREVASKGD